MKPRLWLSLCLCVIGCVRSDANSVRVWRAPGTRAPTYEALGPGEPAFVERVKSPELRAAVESGARAQGVRLDGDGRLAKLAVYAAEHAPEGRMPSRLVEELARHFGLFDPIVEVLLLDVPRESPAEPLMASLEQTLSGRAFTHYGAALHADGDHTWLAVALSERQLALDPVPSVLAVNAPLRLRGVLPEGYAQPRIDVMSEDAPRLLLPAGSEREFNVVLPTAKKGTYRVEVLGDGPSGTVVLAKLPIYVGTKAPAAFEQLRSEPARDMAQLRNQLVQSIQAQRRAAGLPSLVQHAALDAIAERHCLDMRDHGFVAHESLRTGSPADRVRSAGLTSSLVLENILRGQDLRALEPGPQSAEQQNLMHRDVTHMGVGVVEASDVHGPLLLVTELFARLDQSLDSSLAEPNLLSELNAARAQRGYPALTLDRDLSDVARGGAQEFFSDPRATEQSVVDHTHQQLARFAVLYSNVNAVLAVTRELTQVATLEPTLDPAARSVGIGIAQGEREGGRVLAVMVVIAYPR
ncbi:MAG TPA: CAP domain-containing protein [Polyangiales bacterium]|nr:CAP domain-containing protein [Polyangiales bacterium]